MCFSLFISVINARRRNLELSYLFAHIDKIIYTDYFNVSVHNYMSVYSLCNNSVSRDLIYGRHSVYSIHTYYTYIGINNLVCNNWYRVCMHNIMILPKKLIQNYKLQMHCTKIAWYTCIILNAIHKLIRVLNNVNVCFFFFNA